MTTLRDTRRAEPAIDEILADLRELVESWLRPTSVAERRHARLFGVARAPKWMYSSPVGRE